MRRNIFVILTIVCIVLMGLLAGCAGGPEAGGTQEPPPDWVVNVPPDDASFVYFVGSGSSNSADMAEAEEIARGVVKSEIMNFIGVKVTSKTTATAKATLDTFEADLTQQITSEGTGQISGLTIGDKWIGETSSGINVYLLGKYNKNDLMKEKMRIEGIWKEMREAYYGPEREAQAFEAEGRYFEAAIKYIEAAAAAITTDLENPDIKFESATNGAKGSIERIYLVKLNDNLEVSAGETFEEPFLAKVVTGATDSDEAVPGVSILASYKELKSSGKGKSVRSASLKTDEEGLIAFDHPAPSYIGKEKVTFTLDFSAYLKMLESPPREYRGLVDGLEELIGRKRVVFEFNSISNAKNIPTGIVIVDMDENSEPLVSSKTTAGLLSSLTKEKFRVRKLAIEGGEIYGLDDVSIAEMVAGRFGGEVDRLIFGVASLESVNETDGNYIAKVSAIIQVVDLKTGETLLSVDKSKRSMGSNPDAAVSSAYKDVGELIGDEIKNSLR